MQEWEYRQKHHDETMRAMRGIGATKRVGGGEQVLRWGPDVWAALKASGHTSLDINECACHGGRVRRIGP